MRKNPFKKDSDKFKIKPRITSSNSKDIVARRLLWSYLGYWGTFATWLVVSINYIPMIFILGSLMWILGGISAYKIPSESGNIGRKTRFTILGYVLGLMAWRMVSSMIVNTPVELWEQALLMDLPPAFTNTFTGFLSMAFMIAMFMGFVSYLSYIIQLFMFHRTDKKTTDYLQTMTRREDDR